MLIRSSVCMNRACHLAPVFSLGQSVFRRDPSNARLEDKPVKEVEGKEVGISPCSVWTFKSLFLMYLLSLSSNFSLVQRHYNKPSVLGWWRAGWVDSWLCQGVNLGSNCLNSFLQFYFVPIDPLPSEVPAASHSPAFLGFAVRRAGFWVSCTAQVSAFLNLPSVSFVHFPASKQFVPLICPLFYLSFFVPSLSL